MTSREKIIKSFYKDINVITPVQWAEKNRILTPDIAGDRAGPMSYDYTPYLRDIANFILPERPAKYLFIEKGSQIGASVGGIFTMMGWVISESPGNMLFITEKEEKIKEQIQNQINPMINNSGLANKVGSANIREREAKGRRNAASGDTQKLIKFDKGNLYTWSGQDIGNLSSWSIRYGFYDEVERWKGQYKNSGDFLGLVDPRHKFYEQNKKLVFLSTPEILQTSNIHPLYLKGDRQFYNIPCKHCGSSINLLWHEYREKDEIGIVFQRDINGKYKENSVEYVCQECGGTFKEIHKFEMYEEENLSYKKNKNGQHSEEICFWKPTATPESDMYESKHISSLYSPRGFDVWNYMAREWCLINPPSGNIKVSRLHTFINQYLGEPFEERTQKLSSKNLSNNCRWYDSGIVPVEVSQEDGNGDIVLLTCAVDLNGIMGDSVSDDDVRLDYEVKAWSKRGDEFVTSYSVDHGSIGTFKRSKQRKKEGDDDSRIRYTYRHGYENSVWKIFEEEVLLKLYPKADKFMKIALCGIDTGNYTIYANEFVNKHKNCVALKGDSKEKSTFGDQATFSLGSSPGLYIVRGDRLKDKMAKQMELSWNQTEEVLQPEGFLNFPKRTEEKYNYEAYFKEFEGEHKIIIKDSRGNPTGFHWVKRTGDARQHFLDCHIYNDVVKDIAVYLVCKEKKVPIKWENFCKLFG